MEKNGLSGTLKSLRGRLGLPRLPGNMGILRIAYKLLVNDRGKFAALILGMTFAVFLMNMVTSLFAGILHRSSSTMINIGADIWVMDPAVNNPLNSIPMPDYVLDAVRSIKGVKYAVPLYTGGALVKLPNGDYQSATIIGLDDESLYGRPELIEGNIEDIYAENAFIVVKDAEYAKLDNPKLGAVFEVNDHRGVVVGLARATTGGLFGSPTLYTTYKRAVQYLPNTRFTTSYILVEPVNEAAVKDIKEEVRKLGYRAETKDELIDRVATYYKYKTGVGTNIMIMTVISFIVGLSISGQTFYTFVLENMEKFGALKAIGAKGSELIYMILFQAALTSLTGYGLGIGASTLMIIIAKLRLPSYASIITYTNLGRALVMVLVIAGISSYIGVRKVIKIEPFDIFRG